MAYWWVNHKQTMKKSMEQGVIWSPKLTSNGRTVRAYENMRLVRRGDVLFSYSDGVVNAVGTALDGHIEAPKPPGFDDANDAWSAVGWQVPVAWRQIEKPVAPRYHMDVLGHLLPAQHSPLQSNGRGNLFYLAGVSNAFGRMVLDLAGESESILDDVIEEAILRLDPSTTERDQVIKARRGQGLFRSRVMARGAYCRLTGVAIPNLLVASHIKPWRACTNAERLDGANGLMLSPHVDRLFDQGLVSFDGDGRLLAPTLAAQSAVAAWGLHLESSLQGWGSDQAEYLAYHRAHVLMTTLNSSGA